MIGRRRRGDLIAVLAMGLLGCKVGPRDFMSQGNLAPQVRSRAVGLGDRLPEGVVVPALIDRLDDPDGVVRLSAPENLKRRTGQDFGYVPWADSAERAQAVGRWRSWWRGRQAGLAVAGAGAEGGSAGGARVPTRRMR